MTIEIWLVAAILLAALVLFITELVRADVVALLVTLALILTDLVTIDEAFQGFASPAVVTVWAVFIISGGLQRSGVADMLANYMLQLAGESQQRLLVVLMSGAGVMSAFMNNIGAVAILMPAVLTIGRKLNIPASKLLMPLAFAALLGGNITLIGTPPNILATSIMQSRGIEPFGFFDYAPTGLAVLAVGMIYMLTVGHRLLPNRTVEGGLSNEYPVRKYLSELTVQSDSALIGKTVTESNISDRFDVNVMQIERADKGVMNPVRLGPIAEYDTLLVEAAPEQLVQFQQDMRVQPVAGYSPENWHPEMEEGNLHLGEVTLAPNSRHDNLTLGELHFREVYGLSVLAVRHSGQGSAENLRDTPIRFGDTLLVQGANRAFDNLLNDPNLLVLERPQIDLRRTSKAPIAILTLLGVVVVAASGWLPVSAVMLAGALLIVLAGVLSMDEAYRAIDWKAVFLIAGMLPLGSAMETTGAAPLLASQVVKTTGQFGPIAILVVLFVITALLTEVISNAAATVLLVPIAIDIAFTLGLNPQPLIMATVLAASTSFLMPIGHQVNVIIFSAGNYRFSDYARVGVWLNLLLLITAALIIPIIWPFG